MKRLLLCMFIFVCMLCGCDKKSEISTSNVDMSERLITISNSASIEDIASSVVYAIVGIETDMSIGSGVCVASGGYVLTNSHVIHDAEYITLHLCDGTKISAVIVYEDVVQDIAILRADLGMPYLKMADTNDVLVGEDVLAVGTPLSLTLSHSFTKGIVSAVNRTLKVNSIQGVGYMQNLIQHDASLNSGNSGGPLLNTKGEIIGINTLKISGGDGVGFAIPVKAFYSILTSVVGDIEYAVPYLGLFGYDSYIDSTANPVGFYVVDVADNSPVSSIVEIGSIITSINDRPIQNALDFRDELYRYSVGDKIRISFVIDGIENEAIVTLKEKI